ncbi:MAG TPA: VOC family protein [archaeon]|nr:VOC family protein [archaeon]
MTRIMHFEIPADDPARASEFYSKVFGWKFEKWDGPMEYWMITTGKEGEPGINGGMMKKGEKLDRVRNTINVSSIDECVEKIEKAGGKVLSPKMPIPGVGWFTLFTDTEGNVHGLMQPDENAK